MLSEYSIHHIKEYQPQLYQQINRLLWQLTTSQCSLCEQTLRRIIDDKASDLFVVFCGGQIVAMTTLAHYYSPTGCKAWIEDVVVDSNHRQKGVGRAVVEFATEYCKENYSPCTLMLTSNPSRIAANELYRNIGFEQKITNVYKKSL